ncbi:MAG: hypothetical protein IKK43_02365 [Clostridia bacterium]|nr:hypothetical protein [Clostridia bacterium]
MNDMYLNVSSFNDLFKILKNKNSYVDNADSRLEVAQKRQKQLTTYIEQLKSSNMTNKESLMNTEDVLKILNSIIDNLNITKEGLEVIEKNILRLIAKKEDLSYADSDLSEDINKIKKDIDSFDELSTKLNQDIYDKYSIVKNFFANTPALSMYSDPSEDAAFELSNQNNNIADFSASALNNSSINLDIEDNLVLRISERDNKVYLPYTKAEVLKYLETYPKVFKDSSSVINREFIMDLTFYTRHTFLARFREVFSLIRNREMKSFADALKRAFDLMFKYELNPALVAGLKSEAQLDSLLECLEKNTLDEFKPFKIIFEINPAKRH